MLDLTHYIHINICLSSKDKLRFKCPQEKGVGTKSGLYLPSCIYEELNLNPYGLDHTRSSRYFPFWDRKLSETKCSYLYLRVTTLISNEV